MKVFYSIALLVAFAVQLSLQNECHLRELDLCAATALIGVQASPVPQDEQQINEHCKYAKESVDCLRNFTNVCATPLQRELISFITEESEGNLRDFCTPGTQIRKELLQHAKCLADAWSDQRSCADDVQAALETLSGTSGRRITIACCAYQRFRKCGFDIVRQQCGEETEKFVRKLISLYISNLPNIICTNFDPTSQECTSVLPPPGTKPKGAESDSTVSRFIAAYLGNN